MINLNICKVFKNNKEKVNTPIVKSIKAMDRKLREEETIVKKMNVKNH